MPNYIHCQVYIRYKSITIKDSQSNKFNSFANAALGRFFDGRLAFLIGWSVLSIFPFLM